ncbi:Rha family transcriptional regulator [Pseudomonas putida]|nr:Rha family transcriptional regulator [Pseudomonas putida]MDY4320766.1 Rha family transcriptional regulator [Pseudomonas putida]MDY4354135.1 Rha family transcriptional regulator [Pseudomonas putida]
MSSKEIASLTGKRHDNVKRDIVAMLKDLKVDPLNFEDIYLDGRNREQVQYLLDREHTDCLLTGYSPALRMKVIRRWRELEGQSEARQAETANGTKVIGEIAIMECFTRLLKPAPSSQLAMLTKIAENNGLDPQFLPSYAIDSPPDAPGGSSMPTMAVTALLKRHGVNTSAPAFNRELAGLGILQARTRQNSKREPVCFWSVTDKGLRYGKNITSPQCPRETQPHWYIDRFEELVDLVGVGAK